MDVEGSRGDGEIRVQIRVNPLPATVLETLQIPAGTWAFTDSADWGTDSLPPVRVFWVAVGSLIEPRLTFPKLPVG